MKGCVSQCFVAGTLVKTADGHRKIEDIAVGKYGRMTTRPASRD
jgi:hypothetical protein